MPYLSATPVTWNSISTQAPNALGGRSMASTLYGGRIGSLPLGAGNMGLYPQALGTSVSPVTAPPRKPRRISHLTKAKMELMERAVESDKYGHYFSLMHVEDAIKVFEWWNPMHSGRPKGFAQ